jgi:hypothetical protein
MRLVRSRKAPVVQLRPHIASSLAPSPAQEPGEPRGLIMEIIFVYLVELNYITISIKHGELSPTHKFYCMARGLWLNDKKDPKL